MDNEKQQNSNEYYKQYYSKNREQLLAKQCAKVKCKFCDKEVQKVNLSTHQKTKLCAKLQEQKLKDEIRMNKIHYDNGLQYLLSKGADHYRTNVN